MTNLYAGIGPRTTPFPALCMMGVLAKELGERDYHLVSGHGSGADQAWELAAPSDKQTIWLPWAGFNLANNHPAFKVATNPILLDIAEAFHPNWSALTQGAKKLMARNVAIMFGNDFKEPVKFVLYWQGHNINRYKGGTGHTIRIADAYQIPTFNIGNDMEVKSLYRFLKEN